MVNIHTVLNKRGHGAVLDLREIGVGDTSYVLLTTGSGDSKDTKAIIEVCNITQAKKLFNSLLHTLITNDYKLIKA